MSAALVAELPLQAPVVVRTAPRREPPFEDELPDSTARHTPFDRRLPFDISAVRPPVWRNHIPRQRHLPDPATWAHRLLIGMIETSGGRRPMHQLAALVSPSVARGLGAEFERAWQAGAAHWLHRATVRSIRVCEPSPNTAELCAIVETGHRVRAIAIRLEERHERWRCTRLQLG